MKEKREIFKKRERERGREITIVIPVFD